MNANEYQLLAMRTAAGGKSLLNAALGLAGESGEVADLIKKAKFQGHPLDEDKLVEELGDVLWYVALAAEVLGVSLEDIMHRNIDKLWSRYPAGFDPERSQHMEEEQ